MSASALIPLSAPEQLAEPIRNALSGSSLLAVLSAMAVLLLLLALGAIIAAARVLLEPIFALIGTLFRLVVILGAAVAIVLVLVSGSAHATGPGDADVGRSPFGTVP